MRVDVGLMNEGCGKVRNMASDMAEWEDWQPSSVKNSRAAPRRLLKKRSTLSSFFSKPSNPRTMATIYTIGPVCDEEVSKSDHHGDLRTPEEPVPVRRMVVARYVPSTITSYTSSVDSKEKAGSETDSRTGP